MFKKLFGGSKNDFYLEIKEDDTSTKPQPTATNNGAKPAAKPVGEEPKVETPAPEASESVAETTTESGKKQKTFRKQTAKETASAKPASTPAPAPVAAVKTAPKEPEIKNFAPTYLIPSSTNGRRRPGPNMNAFLDMARQVKVTPSKIAPKTSK